MFLVLALTGQMRVFLEAAPAELSQLLTDWKNESAKSLSDIMAAIALLKESQQEQAGVVKQNLEAVSSECVADIKEAGMATVSAIAEANSETLERVRQTKKQAQDLIDEFTALHKRIEADRWKNNSASKAFLNEVELTRLGLKKMNARIDKSISAVEQLQQNATWLKLAECVSSFRVTLIVGFVNLGVGWCLELYMNR